MRYVALITSEQCCDYSIACGKTFHVFQAPDHPGAIKYCKKIWDDLGGKITLQVKAIDLFSISEKLEVPLADWEKVYWDESEKASLSTELAQIEARADEIRRKLGKS